MNARLFRELIDFHFNNKNMTWVDRLARAEFNFTDSEVNTSDRKITQEVNRLENFQKISQPRNDSTSTSDVYNTAAPRWQNGEQINVLTNKSDPINDTSSDDEKQQVPSKFISNIDRHTYDNFNEQNYIESLNKNKYQSADHSDGQPLGSGNQIVSNGKSNSTSHSPEVVKIEKLRKSMIRLQYHIGLYPYWKELEGSVPTLLDELQLYESKHALDLPSLLVISK